MNCSVEFTPRFSYMLSALIVTKPKATKQRYTGTYSAWRNYVPQPRRPRRTFDRVKKELMKVAREDSRQPAFPRSRAAPQATSTHTEKTPFATFRLPRHKDLSMHPQSSPVLHYNRPCHFQKLPTDIVVYESMLIHGPGAAFLIVVYMVMRV